MDKNTIASNINNVRKMISDACDKIITNPSKIDLIAVSKTQSSEVIKLAYECGQFEFGENYVQESTGKQINLKDLSIHWHFIGHLQKNKVKSVVGTFKLIHQPFFISTKNI